jgi:UDP-N-acetylmuramyl pentapeptide phosphotransferase/UDP-N-acetylglucosamine-1-phosphate transferase
MSVLLGLVVGFGAVRLLLLAAPDLYRSPALARTNSRGRAVATGGGLLVVLAVVLVEGTRIGLGALGIGDQPGFDGTRPLVLLTCVGFGFLGLLDDLLASGEESGFRGHLHALARGRMTTGFVKLVVGVAFAFVVAAAPGSEPRVRLIVDAALIASAANLANLFDRAPGRALKVGIVAWIPLAIIAGGDALGIAMAPVIGAFVAIGPEDLGERLMLGDVGANVLGAIVGLAAVLETSPTTRVVIAALLVGLNAVSEWVSFGRVIERVSLLRRIDDFGGRPHP